MIQRDLAVTHPHQSTSITVPPEYVCQLAVGQNFRLPRLPGTPLPRRQLRSTYYDTTTYNLAQAGITLRRQSHRGKTLWKLKLPLGEDRQEIEVTDGRADPPTLFCDVLVLHLGQQKLVPVVTLGVRRTGVLVRDGRLPIAEVVLDNVTVWKNGSVIQRFRELGIERRQGDETSLHSLEQQLRDVGAFDHDGQPTFFRAISLPAPTSTAQPRPKAPLADHLKWALAQHVGWLLAHDPGTRLGIECESLHQMRVATRRLRAMLHTAGPALLPAWEPGLLQELKWLSALLGPARDLDVQIAYFKQEAVGLGTRDRKLLAQFCSHLQEQRGTVQKLLLSELTSARYLELIRRLQQTSQDPSVVESPLTVRQLAKREFKKLRKAINRLASSPSDVQLHKIRIKAKRVRYAAELARNSAQNRVRRFIKSVREVQDLLGIHQDAIQAEQYVRQFLKYSTSVRAGFLAGRMVERLHQRCHKIRQDMKPLFKALVKRGKHTWR